MAKYEDVRKVGGSASVPFISGEDPSDRHARRKIRAAQDLSLFKQWCSRRGLSASVQNEGHHWIVQGQSFYAEWWPSSAKLVLNRRYERGIHCHDVEQVQRAIQDEMTLRISKGGAK